MRSAPEPPLRQSSPASPEMTSLPRSPKSVSPAAVPMSLSAASVPRLVLYRCRRGAIAPPSTRPATASATTRSRHRPSGRRISCGPRRHREFPFARQEHSCSSLSALRIGRACFSSCPRKGAVTSRPTRRRDAATWDSPVSRRGAASRRSTICPETSRRRPPTSSTSTRARGPGGPGRGLGHARGGNPSTRGQPER